MTKMNFDRLLAIIAFISSIVFGVLSLDRTGRFTSIFFIFAIILFAITLILFFRGKKIINIINRYFESILLFINSRPLKKYGIISKKTITKKNKKIRYGYSLYQDTILPLFFDYVHRYSLKKYNLNIEFIEIPWNEHVPAFENDQIDVSLGNLFTVLPFYVFNTLDQDKLKLSKDDKEKIINNTPSNFFPFFEFQGQHIFFRKRALNKIQPIGVRNNIESEIFGKKISFFDVVHDRNERKNYLNDIFKNSQIVYMANTDLQASYNILFHQYNIDPNSVQPNWEKTIVGYERFLNEDHLDSFCGGLAESYSLYRKFKKENDADFFPLCSGKDLGLFSVNGLVTTKKFMENNYIIYRELIEIWYWSIKEFIKDFNNKKDSSINNIIDFLNTSLTKNPMGGKIDLSISEELIEWMIIKEFERFYKDPFAAFKEYYIGDENDKLMKALEFIKNNQTLTSYDIIQENYSKINSTKISNMIKDNILSVSKKYAPDFILNTI